MKQINDNSGDIFAKQPFSVISNIHNVNDPERVLGYFQVSAVKQRRKNLPFSEIVALNLPFYHYPCERMEKEPLDFQIFIMGSDYYMGLCISNYEVTSTYLLVEPIYLPESLSLEKLVFTTPECANCELTGTRQTRFLG